MTMKQGGSDTTVDGKVAAACPICGSVSPQSGVAAGWGEWHQCPSCDLEFVQPMKLAETPETLYDEAYRGKRNESVMDEFHDRIAIREALTSEPELWFWTPAFQKTLDWLDENVSPGGTVLELGCGLGFFLHAARNRGYNIKGLDVALKAVELNRGDGFDVWHGTLESMPADWVQPEAIVCFFMLHHLQEPLAFFKRVAQNWPNAKVAASQYGPSNRDAHRSSPPRTLTRWGSKSLKALLTNAGYDASTINFAGSGAQHGLLNPVRKTLKKSLAVPPVYRAIRRVEHAFFDRALTPLEKEAYVAMVMAEPRG